MYRGLNELKTVTQESLLAIAYHYITDPKDSQNPDHQAYARAILRYHAFYYDNEIVAAVIGVLRTKPAIDPDYLRAFDDAVTWAEAEKRKPAKALLEIAKTMTIPQNQGLQEDFREAYKQEATGITPPHENPIAKLCLPDSRICSAYSWLTDKRSSEKNIQYAKAELYLFSLMADNTLTRESIRILKSHPNMDKDFIRIIEESRKWALTEKTKSAEELYKISQGGLASFPSNLIKELFESAYLSLALEKGSPEARAQIMRNFEELKPDQTTKHK